MTNELIDHQVAIVVFASVLAVDVTDAALVAEAGIRQSLADCAVEDADHLTIRARFGEDRVAIRIHRMDELGVASESRYVKTVLSHEAYGERS